MKILSPEETLEGTNLDKAFDKQFIIWTNKHVPAKKRKVFLGLLMMKLHGAKTARPSQKGADILDSINGLGHFIQGMPKDAKDLLGQKLFHRLNRAGVVVTDPEDASNASIDRFMQAVRIVDALEAIALDMGKDQIPTYGRRTERLKALHLAESLIDLCASYSSISVSKTREGPFHALLEMSMKTLGIGGDSFEVVREVARLG